MPGSEWKVKKQQHEKCRAVGRILLREDWAPARARDTVTAGPGHPAGSLSLVLHSGWLNQVELRVTVTGRLSEYPLGRGPPPGRRAGPGLHLQVALVILVNIEEY